MFCLPPNFLYKKTPRNTAAIDANAESDTYTLRGEAYMQLGDYQKALSDFDAAIEIDGVILNRF